MNRHCYYQQLDGRMFDFAAFYSAMVDRLPNEVVLAEVGVAGCASACFLAEQMLNRRRLSFKFYWIDSLDYGQSNQLNDILKVVCRAGLADYVEVLPMDSLHAAARFPDEHFDFVFLDSSHKYEMTKAEIRLWYPKLKEGGILAGHDYKGTKEVQDAVDVVVPKLVIRDPVPNKQYHPEPVLVVEDTAQGYGVWWFQRKFYVKIN